MEVEGLSKTPCHNPEDPILIDVLLPHLDIGCRFFPKKYYLCIRKHGVGIHKTALKVGSLYSEDRRSVILYTTLHDIAYKI